MRVTARILPLVALVVLSGCASSPRDTAETSAAPSLSRISTSGRAVPPLPSTPVSATGPAVSTARAHSETVPSPAPSPRQAQPPVPTAPAQQAGSAPRPSSSTVYSGAPEFLKGPGTPCGAVADPAGGAPSVEVLTGRVNCTTGLQVARALAVAKGDGPLALAQWQCTGRPRNGRVTCDDGQGNSFRVGG